MLKTIRKTLLLIGVAILLFLPAGVTPRTAQAEPACKSILCDKGLLPLDANGDGCDEACVPEKAAAAQDAACQIECRNNTCPPNKICAQYLICRLLGPDRCWYQDNCLPSCRAGQSCQLCKTTGEPQYFCFDDGSTC